VRIIGPDGEFTWAETPIEADVPVTDQRCDQCGSLLHLSTNG
jgi:hypothetical protein